MLNDIRALVEPLQMPRYPPAMTRAEQFAAALQKQVSPDGPQSVRGYWDEQRKDWVEDLKQLRVDIRKWLEPAVNANAAKVTDNDYSTTEPDLGTYMAPGLRIELLVNPPVSVDIRPRGCRIGGLVIADEKRVFGAVGRVDIERGADREILLRYKNDDSVRWLSYASGEKQIVDEGTFLDLLSGVAGLNLSDA